MNGNSGARQLLSVAAEKGDSQENFCESVVYEQESQLVRYLHMLLMQSNKKAALSFQSISCVGLYSSGLDTSPMFSVPHLGSLQDCHGSRPPAHARALPSPPD